MSNIGVWENAEPGVKRCILRAEDSLMMMEVHFAKGAEGYEHSHPHQQMSYCLRGSFIFRIDGREYCIGTGDTINIPGNAKHGVTALEEDSALLDVFTPIREDLVKR
ncbi:cupin domain-containing protein [Paenibacillus macerans]|uniref:cupin domain-containing protein n=1 Tax=Paenibacillus macerans TaxID=44252 RepID=UPI00203CB8F5|nr:cupin domain-containing protein [Paenibacillus macerans]MCM3697900.1 cupin domain-containing protein [Paenibacillus macerans]MED4954746.1 cupin domain-containing protein [Paenibacillus macerans]